MDQRGDNTRCGDSARGVHPSGGDDCWAKALRVETLTTQAPSNAVKAESLSVFLGSRCLLEGADLTIAEQSRAAEVPVAAESGRPRAAHRGACYGLVGPNGCGKSTLLRILADGHVPTPPAWQVMMVGQHLPPCAGRNPVEEVLAADARRAALLEEQRMVEEVLDSGVYCGEVDDGAVGVAAAPADELLRASQRLAEVEQQLDHWSGAEHDIARILLALGFRRPATELAVGSLSEESKPSLTTSMQHLSGGWRMKVQLAKALWLKPHLLLLDEPTNHLDFEALRWLEEQIDEYPHTIVVVSHDVSFLHEVCREILWIKDRKIEPLPRDALSAEDLARMQRTKPLNFRFTVPDDGPPQDHGVSVHNVVFSYPSESSGSQPTSKALRVKGDVRFSGQSRAVMLGRNGSGKSTFLALCAGKLHPSSGSVDQTQGCRIGHYDQLMDEIDRCGELTAVEYLIQQCREPLEARMDVKARAAESSAERRGGKAAASALHKQLVQIARGVLSGFGFDGDLAIAVPVGQLSGGQKARLKLAALSLRPAHILFLDEPTNHLDAEACEALAQGLSEFQGGIVVVTHDDLLIYRLIQCNWSRSELLTCHAGKVRCHKDFGGQCLKTLKEQVRRSEAAGSCSEVVEPPSPKRGAKVTARDPGSTPAQLPPWLASQRTGTRIHRKCKEAVSATEESRKAQLDTESQPSPGLSSVATPARLRGREEAKRAEATSELEDVVRKAKRTEEKQPLQSRFATISKSPIAPAVVNQQTRPEPMASLPNIPDRWDDDNDDDQNGRDVVMEARPRLEQIAHAAQNAGSNDRAHHDGESQPTAFRKASNHSRLRKDIVNLNKGLAKWLAKEGEGLFTRDDVIQRIRSSAAARHLADAHGDAYQEMEFIQSAIERAQASASRTA